MRMSETIHSGQNSALTPYRRDTSIQQLFLECAQQFPNKPALVQGDRVLTYLEVDALANRLAANLQKRGVTPGSYVGIFAHRSIETVLALLATLKCGAAYVPFDPGYPAEQLKFMLEDATPVLMLAQKNIMQDGQDAGLLDLLAIEDLLDENDPDDLPSNVEGHGGDAAYIMYTSGSTGKPKGVIIPHMGIQRLVRDQDYATFDEHQTMLQLSPLAWDLSTFEIWGALLNGGQLAIMPQPHPSLDEIADTINRYKVTILWFTAGLFHLMVDNKLDQLHPLKQIVAGGDVLSPTHVKAVLEQLPDCVMVNGYGPTENTTFTTCYVVPREDWGDGGVPIGVSLNHGDVAILDENLQPVAEGEVGELCTGGDGVALGYLNRPEQTAEVFVKHPFSSDPDAMLYRTGDLAMMRPDGNLDFLGRKDRQVKISGKRIELDEIELALRKNELLLDAAVTMQTGEHLDDKRLAAYILPKAPFSEAELVAELFVQLREKLPKHMIPSQLAILEEMPLTANGKVDRKSLVDYETKPVAAISTVAGLGDSPSAGTTDLEKMITDVWSDVLDVENPGPTSNFFDLGGNSLNLMDVHAKIQKNICREFDIVDLFQHTTIKAQASFLGEEQSSGQIAQKARTRAKRQSGALARARKRKQGLSS